MLDKTELVDSITPVTTYILDTCTLLHDPNSLFAFKDDDVVIPLVVIEELDDKKTRDDDLGKKARQVSRLIDGLLKTGDLLSGVSLPNGGMLYVVDCADIVLPQAHIPKRSQADDVIVQLALKYKSEKEPAATVVTRDVNLRIKCVAKGVPCQDYSSTRLIEESSSLYSGVTKIDVDEWTVEDVYNGEFTVEDLEDLTDEPLRPNHIFILKSEQRKSAIVRYDHDQLKVVRVRDEKEAGPWKLKPRNKEQNFALDLLMNRDIQLVTLVGSAGTGKTLLAIAAGLGQVLDSKLYNKLIVTRPIQPLGNDLGYLPGTMEEKMAPWIAPIIDNLKTLTGKDEQMLSLWMDKGILEVEAITYIRGRSIPDTFMIIDEAQNLTAHELKTIITRAGANTKIVLTGDIEQIDNRSVDSTTNGLAYAIEKFKDHTIAGHVTLLKGERSKLASLAAKIL
jgi:PhoH-like ATPase